MDAPPLAYIVSLRYAPGLAKEFRLLGEQLHARGWNVKFILAHAYRWLMQGTPCEVDYVTNGTSLVCDGIRLVAGDAWRLSAMLRKDRPNFVICYNVHPCNPLVVRLAARARPSSIRALYCHEPYHPDKHGFNLAKRVMLAGAEWLTSLAIPATNHMVLPSEVAVERFRSRYPYYAGLSHLCPIVVPDYGAGCIDERIYLTYVGRVNRATGLDLFVEAANRAVECGREFPIQIVTPDPIDRYLKVLHPAARRLARILNKARIPDDEIAAAMKQSIAVVRLDVHLTQSGVVPVAYSTGTPVVARSIPALVQHVRHKLSGYLVPEHATPDDVVEAAHYVRQNLRALCRGARAMYLELFSPHKWGSSYQWLIHSGTPAPEG